MEGWTKIYSSDQSVQVEAVKAILLENNIESVEVSNKASVYIIGDIDLYVKQDSEIMARLIISQHSL
jgi:hypothetical protein